MSKKRKRRSSASSVAKPVTARRKSRRLEAARAAPVTHKPTILLTSEGRVVPEWATRLLEDVKPRKQRRVRRHWEWNSYKTHQHLRVSSDRSRVAVIGCAGYGASLGRPRKRPAGLPAGKGKDISRLHFRVAVIKMGVGGFAVGIAGAKFRKPFKSIGRHPLGWVLHSSGSLWHNGKKQEGWCKAFGAGDVIGVEVHNSCLTFFINGESQGVAFRGISGRDGSTILPAVQPYMGGVAECLS